MLLPEDLSEDETAQTDATVSDVCWDKTITPAVIETVTEQVMVKPAELYADGTVKTPATHETQTIQKIVQERQETRFEIPCPDVMTPDFIMSVQRALKARGYYSGPISGQMSSATQSAIRDYQKKQGLDSSTLSVDAARKLGLIMVERS
ncbi:peptidoglycan-binding domain-containing protein [Phaeobacter marinintestinus]|uniref:peptidoglycan-binding domain-containing protein n=1 Tax=Falsiphaeobacter marinintestinus TaxID=1492905 RepID=UPI001FE2CF42|nr:peptidoglycan-binding domain-containing protein [Phaeobacter marinintestinus]